MKRAARVSQNAIATVAVVQVWGGFAKWQPWPTEKQKAMVHCRLRSSYIHLSRWTRDGHGSGWVRLGRVGSNFLAAFFGSVRLGSMTLWLVGSDDCVHGSRVAVLFGSLAVLHPRVGHTMDILSPFIPVLCHSDWLFWHELIWKRMPKLTSWIIAWVHSAWTACSFADA